MRGGNRQGAGRKKGSRNKATAAQIAAVAASGEVPLDHLLKIMRDESQPTSVRVEAAKAAAPYCHPKLASVEPRDSGEGRSIVRKHRIVFV